MALALVALAAEAAPPAAALAVALLVAAIVELVVSTGRCANDGGADTDGAELERW